MKLKSIFMLILVLLVVLSSNIYAVDKIFGQAKDFVDTGKKNTGATIDTTKLKSTSDTIFNVFFGVGVGVAVVVGAILGLQFMQAGIDKKVQVKEALVAYVISCIVLFGAFGIWRLAVAIMSSIS